MKTLNEKIEIMQACQRGEQIEFMDCSREWKDTPNPIWDWAKTDYRVKPKPKYVPFETAEEFLEAQRKHGEGLISIYDDCVMKAHNISITLDGLVYDHTEKIDGSNCLCIGDLEDLLVDYNFADGTSCGKEVEK